MKAGRAGLSSAINSTVIDEIRDNIKGQLLHLEPMKNHTTYKTGGAAKLLACPRDSKEAEWLYRFAHRHEIGTTVIGAGSNIIAPRRGIEGLVIKTRSSGARLEFKSGERLIAEAGVYLDSLIRRAAERGFGGLAALAGIPGTVGGAVFMNAGTRKGDISRVVNWVEALTADGEKLRLNAGEIEFGYRESIFRHRPWLILRGEFRLQRADMEKTLHEIDRIWEKRMRSYPMQLPTAGSVFKNPEGRHAGELIDRAGCGGMRVGGAMVSEMHANFIVNLGGANSDDIIELVRRVRKKVFQKFGVFLQLEQKIIRQQQSS
ncbi:MAG: UDP-N-acetylmuramate dehydrogenase [Candidatus Latescibacteria bacterium]|nr:UDP-N-acetylmuramate dehydrogenase [bacterium]MBD3423013.1 UDP-N-acetylmuramate dehydrogenase [Candidatus Latescibacterota bacterium]